MSCCVMTCYAMIACHAMSCDISCYALRCDVSLSKLYAIRCRLTILNQKLSFPSIHTITIHSSADSDSMLPFLHNHGHAISQFPLKVASLVPCDTMRCQVSLKFEGDCLKSYILISENRIICVSNLFLSFYLSCTYIHTHAHTHTLNTFSLTLSCQLQSSCPSHQVALQLLSDVDYLKSCILISGQN